jgi:putative transposase
MIREAFSAIIIVGELVLPVIDPRFTYRSENVVEALERACGRLGYPKAIRVDQGTEFVSRNLDLWAYAHGVTLDFSRPDANS